MIEGLLQLATGIILFVSTVFGDAVVVPAPPPPPAIEAPAPDAGACKGGASPNPAGRCPEDVGR